MKYMKSALMLVLTLVVVMCASMVAFAEEDVTESAPIVIEEQSKTEDEAKADDNAKAGKKSKKKNKNKKKADAAPEAEAEAETEVEVEAAPEVEAEVEAEAATETETEQVEQQSDADENADAAIDQDQDADDQDEDADDQDLVIIEDEQTPLAPRPATLADGSVRIFSTTQNPSFGDRVTLNSELKGFDGDYALLFQWQIDRGDGWQNIPGANGRSYDFTFGKGMENCSWRLVVQIDE